MWTVVDLFSGAGGMSHGFHAHPNFTIVGAVDAEVGKPSSGVGSLQCNSTYEANIGLVPLAGDLARLSPGTLRWEFGIDRDPDVLISCAPCTGFSRVLPNNHLVDDPRNSLVACTSAFIEEFRPSIFLMENARELINGRFAHHLARLREDLTRLGYTVHSGVNKLDQFGLAQRRERALVIAAKDNLTLRTLDDLWDGYEIDPEAAHVRRAISRFPPIAAGEAHPSDPVHVSPQFSDRRSLERLQCIPHDGGSWADLCDDPSTRQLLTPAMVRYMERGEFGSHPDVYGRLWWDRPAVTIKRECGHVGNGRYSHPDQDRLCTVREMSVLQGFPDGYEFVATAVTNMYRHVGDAVPPLIAYQLAKICEWMLTAVRPPIESVMLERTHLTTQDLREAPTRHRQLHLAL